MKWQTTWQKRPGLQNLPAARLNNQMPMNQTLLVLDPKSLIVHAMLLLNAAQIGTDGKDRVIARIDAVPQQDGKFVQRRAPKMIRCWAA